MAKKGLNIYKRKDGRWEGRMLLENAEGKKKYRSIYAHSYSETRKKLLELSVSCQKPTGKPLLTVQQVMEQWLNDRHYIWKESTYSCYRQLVNRYFAGSIGMISAREFTNIKFHAFLRGIKCVDGSPASLSYLHNIGAAVIQAFYHANREYHYELPVLKNIKVPGGGRNLVLPADTEMQRLRSYLYRHKEDSTCIGILVAYYTGIRLGELCALKWGDIDFTRGNLTVSSNMQRVRNFTSSEAKTDIRIQPPKTATSFRTIPLPDELILLLQQSKRKEADYIIQGRNREWAEARTVQYRFQSILKECEIEHFKFHMLRHHFATACIQCGFDVKSLSEILGHATVQTTLNLYVHSSMNQKRKLMNHVFQTAED